MENIFETMRKQREEKTQALMERPEHPLYVFSRENCAIRAALKKDLLDETFRKNLAIHYAKKGDLLYPLLKEKYGVAGPSDMMWTTDGAIKGALKADAEDAKALVEKMCLLEDSVLFPNCAEHLSEEDWMGVYRDMQDYAICFGVTGDVWPEAEKAMQAPEDKKTIVLPGGTFHLDELRAVLNTLPMEITFVDASDKNCFFNEGPKDFKRPLAALGRDVLSCHPPKVAEKVKRILTEFKNGTLDELPVWMERNGKTVLVKYMAVRDENQKYLGTLEIVQDLGFAKEHFEKKTPYYGEE